MNQNTLIAFLATLIAFLPVSRPPKKHPCINIEQYGKHQHTSSTHGSWKNSLLLSSSCRTVIPSVGPLPRMLSRSRDCDSSQVWINLAGSSAKDRRNVCFKWELCKDCASKAIWLTGEEWSAEAPSVSFFRMARRSGFYTSSSNFVNVATDSLDIWTEVAIRFLRVVSSIFISTSQADGRSGGGTVGFRR